MFFNVKVISWWKSWMYHKKQAAKQQRERKRSQMPYDFVVAAATYWFFSFLSLVLWTDLTFFVVKWKGRYLSYWTLMANNDNGQRWFSWGASWTMFCNETHLTFGENIDNPKRNLLVNFPTHPSLTSYKKFYFILLYAFWQWREKAACQFS